MTRKIAFYVLFGLCFPLAVFAGVLEAMGSNLRLLVQWLDVRLLNVRYGGRR